MKYHISSKIKFVVFDLDGVFYRDHEALHGGKDIIEFLDANDIGYCFLTNNSCFPLQTYQDKLKVCGITINEEKIITTTSLLTSYITSRQFKDIYVLGSPHLKSILYENFTYNDVLPDALVVGMHDHITLEDISKAISVLGENSEIIAANPDKLIPKSGGFGLECGVILDILHSATDKKSFVVGKPNRYAFDFILENFNVRREEVLMVGDTYDTDILGAINSDIKAAWVKTGNALPKDIDYDQFISLDSLHDLIKILL
ncbi:MAG: HAD-IIA family hydrolase [Sulfurospirillaceae bacterium]|nr:HAD-IIA family hydrolase [Sulfurospirillaceae bacterium]